MHHILTLKRFFKSSAYLNLNANLSNLGLFWSESKSEILNIQSESVALDQKEAINSFLRLAAVACFTSMIGCVFLLIFIFSLRVLAKSRLEKRILNCKLTQQKKLEFTEVKNIVLGLQAEFSLDSFQLK